MWYNYNNKNNEVNMYDIKKNYKLKILVLIPVMTTLKKVTATMTVLKVIAFWPCKDCKNKIDRPVLNYKGVILHFFFSDVLIFFM